MVHILSKLKRQSGIGRATSSLTFNYDKEEGMGHIMVPMERSVHNVKYEFCFINISEDMAIVKDLAICYFGLELFRVSKSTHVTIGIALSKGPRIKSINYNSI